MAFLAIPGKIANAAALPALPAYIQMVWEKRPSRPDPLGVALLGSSDAWQADR